MNFEKREQDFAFLFWKKEFHYFHLDFFVPFKEKITKELFLFLPFEKKERRGRKEQVNSVLLEV